MKLKLICLYSFFIFCLTLRGRKVGAFTCSSGKLVQYALNLIEFYPLPNNAAEWEKAFILLSSEYITMKKNLTAEYTMMKNKLTSEYTMMKNNLTTEYTMMKNNPSSECGKWKDEYLKVVSVEFTRKIIDDGDLTLTYGGFAFPTIADMKKKLQKEKGQLDETAVSEAKNLGDYETKRRMRWLYYMTYAETNFAKKLRKLLRTWKVSAFTLSRFIDTVYTVSCGKIPDFSVKGLDVKDAQAGFQMYGVFDKCLLDCVRIVFEIPKLTGFLPDPEEGAPGE